MKEGLVEPMLLKRFTIFTSLSSCFVRVHPRNCFLFQNNTPKAAATIPQWLKLLQTVAAILQSLAISQQKTNSRTFFAQ